MVVSLPFEPGREAFKATATLRERLKEIAAEERGARRGQRPLRQGLARGAARAGARRSSSPAARTADAGRRRRACTPPAASEPSWSCAAPRWWRCCAPGTAPGDVAVVFRDPPRYASLVEQVFGAYGIPYSIDRTVPFAHTGVGRGLLALLRCALLEGSADDLLAYLRTPGLVREPGAGRPARGRRAPPRRARRPAARGAVGGAPGPLAAGRDRRAARRAGHRRAARERLATGWSGCSPRPTGARAARAAGRRAGRPARLPRRPRRADRAARAWCRPTRTWRWTRATCTTRSPSWRCGVGEEAADRPRAGGLAAGRPRAAVRRRVRLRPPGERVPRARLAGRRSCPTPTGASWPAPAAWRCRCARTGWSASATCSTSARRAPSGGWC